MKKSCCIPLFAVLLLAGCAQKDPVAGEAAADWHPAPVAAVQDPHQALADKVTGAGQSQSPVLRQGMVLPETSELEGTQSKQASVPAVPVVVNNPDFEEHFLFKSAVGRQAVSETITNLDPGGNEISTPLFDAVGEQAKDEYVQAALLNQTGYNTKALEHYYKAVERDPDNFWLKNRAAQAALYQNDLPRARKFAEEVLAADKDNYQAMLVLGAVATAREQRAEARQWFESVVSVRPKHIEALENLTRMAYEDKDYEKTKEFAARIMNVTGTNLNAILWHAEASALTGDISHAATLYERLIHYRPMLISRLSDMGIRLLRQGDLDAARELFRRGVAMQPETELIRLQWEALLRETEGEAAIDAGYKQMIGDNPLDLRIHELYANYLGRRNEFEKLTDQRQAMLEIDPRHVPSLLSLGNIALRKNDLEKAKEYFEKAIAAGPQQSSTFRDIAIVYMQNKEYKRAGELIQEALVIDPSDSQNYIAFAALDEQQEKYKEAEAHLKKAIDLSPANEQYLRLLGDFYRNRGQMEEASQVYEQVLAVNPSDASAQVTLARLYFDLNNSAQLDRLQKSAVLIVEDKSTFYTHYGFLAVEYGEWNRARWAFEHALGETPKDQQTRRALALTYLHLGENKLAEETLQRGEPHLAPGDEAQKDHALALLSIYSHAREYEKALAKAQELATKYPDDFDIQATVISSYIDAGKKKEATDKLGEMVRQFAVSKPVETQRLRAEVYRNMEEYDRAAGVLMPLVDTAENPVEIIFELAVVYGEKEDLAKAEQYYERVIREVNAQDNATTGTEGYLVNAYNNLAYLYANSNTKLDKAEEYANKALKMRPAADYIMDTVGWVYFRQGKLEEAEKLLKKAEKLSLPDPELYEHMGDLYTAMDNRPEAIRYYEKALATDPEKAAHVRAKLDQLNTAVGSAAPASATKAQ